MNFEKIVPNLKVITLRPLTSKEFALKDKQVGVVIQECQEQKRLRQNISSNNFRT